MNIRTVRARVSCWPGRALWTLGLLLIAALPVHAQRGVFTEAPQSVEQALKATLRNPAVLDRVLLEQYPATLDRERRALLLAFLTKRMQDDRLISFLTKSVTPLMQAKATRPQIVRHVQEQMFALQVRGLTRMRDDMAEEFFRLSMRMAQAISPADCKKMMLSQLDTPTMLVAERQYQAVAPLADLRKMIEVYEFSLNAELADFPARRGIKELDSVTRSLFQKSLAKHLVKFPAGVADRVLANPSASDPRDLCPVYIEVSLAGLDLTGAARTTFLDYMLGQAAN
ncbi:hypothetical protein [Variovorax sp. EL159]|uniref:hypothetical protein n=1 Tax=Variovorax sp. EL159 TaxID=1566270 RepID=UPI000880F169|nr:hypothetical protein [Variovorax sp. EL159]SCX44730.1 hypothetical protein SAMN03159363_0783 [Variovorax sp. EL159]